MTGKNGEFMNEAMGGWDCDSICILNKEAIIPIKDTFVNNERKDINMSNYTDKEIEAREEFIDSIRRNYPEGLFVTVDPKKNLSMGFKDEADIRRFIADKDIHAKGVGEYFDKFAWQMQKEYENPNNMTLYQYDNDQLLRAEGTYKGVDFVILDYDDYYCAYIKIHNEPNKVDYDSFQEFSGHYDLTWSGSEQLTDKIESEGTWIGWDYNHTDDKNEIQTIGSVLNDKRA